MAVHLPIAEPDPIEDDRLLRVGDLAQRTQKTVRAMHLYEELGLLRPSDRSKGGFRLYGPDAVMRVRWIGKLQELGFSLPEIREVLGNWEKSPSATDAALKVRDLYRAKLDETRAQIAKLEALRQDLEHSIDYLDACETCDPERLVHACPKCDLHHCTAPDLVAGLHIRGAENKNV